MRSKRKSASRSPAVAKKQKIKHDRVAKRKVEKKGKKKSGGTTINTPKVSNSGIVFSCFYGHFLLKIVDPFFAI